VTFIYNETLVMQIFSNSAALKIGSSGHRLPGGSQEGSRLGLTFI